MCAKFFVIYYWPKIQYKPNETEQESCAIAKMTARCALYK